MELPKTIDEWVSQNEKAYPWYYKEYPFLTEFILPIQTHILLDFYIEDFSSRNFTPLDEYKNNYSLLFSYFLDNYTRVNDETRFKGKTKLGYIIDSIPKAIKKSVDDIGKTVSDVFDVSKYVFLIVAVILILYFVTQIKK